MQEKERLRKDMETKIRILLHNLIILILLHNLIMISLHNLIILSDFKKTISWYSVLIIAGAREGEVAEGHRDQDPKLIIRSGHISNCTAFFKEPNS